MPMFAVCAKGQPPRAGMAARPRREMREQRIVAEDCPDILSLELNLTERRLSRALTSEKTVVFKHLDLATNRSFPAADAEFAERC